jgi:hypothetical protein
MFPTRGQKAALRNPFPDFVLRLALNIASHVERAVYYDAKDISWKQSFSEELTLLIVISYILHLYRSAIRKV